MWNRNAVILAAAIPSLMTVDDFEDGAAVQVALRAGPPAGLNYMAPVEVGADWTQVVVPFAKLQAAALERWCRGDPDGFLTTYAPDVTYFDPQQERRVDGLPAMTALLAPVRGKLHIDRFEMLSYTKPELTTSPRP